MQDLPWRNIWSVDNPVEVLNEHLPLLVRRFDPTKVIRVSNKNNPWFDDQCRRFIFGGPVIVFELTGYSLSAVR